MTSRLPASWPSIRILTCDSIVNTDRNVLVTPAHSTSYLEAGPEDGLLLVFVHGWPGLASTWRHQLGHFAARGYRVVAPDLRGYGDSTVHDDPAAYRQELVVADMLALLDHLGRRRAVWIGHDWGSPTVWNIAAHFPERCAAVATLAVPFGRLERGWDGLLPMIDRDRYPTDTSPYGQFDYMAFYEGHAAQVTSVFEAVPGNTVKVVFRRGNPAVHTFPAPTSTITRDGGWFGGAPGAPDVPLSTTVLDERDFTELTEAFARNGFGGHHQLLPQSRGKRPLRERGPGRPACSGCRCCSSARPMTRSPTSAPPRCSTRCGPTARLSPRLRSRPGTGCTWRRRRR